MDYTDSELLHLVKEESEEAKDILFEKYHYLIKVILKKYTMSAKILNIDYTDLYQEALLGFTDALNRYDDTSSSLRTFIALCVDRKLQTVLRNAQTLKNKVLNESLSLETPYEENQPLMDILSDDNKNNPLIKVENAENFSQLLKQIKNTLSASEYEVFTLMANNYSTSDIASILNKENKQIDNASQRIKNKIKNILKHR